MIQLFNRDTILSKYIKNLLATEDIPLLTYIEDGDDIIKDCFYIYDNVVIKCTKSGTVFPNAIQGNLYPGITIFPSFFLYPRDGYLPAEYTVIDFYENIKESNCYRYHSTSSSYDSELHYHLGNYLRGLKRIYPGIMSLYNCFNNRFTEALHLDIHGHIVKGKNSAYTVALIPIRFNESYTIYFNSSAEVYLKPIFYSMQEGLLDQYTAALQQDSLTIKKQGVSYITPITFSISTANSSLYSHQKDLILLFQYPSSVDSNLNVIEGAHTRENCKLLSYNAKYTVPFSETLIDYITNNAIHPQYEYQQSIQAAQKSLAVISEKYDRAQPKGKTINTLAKSNNYYPNLASYHTYLEQYPKSMAIWTSRFQQALDEFVQSIRDEADITDYIGCIDKSVEQALAERGGMYESIN